MKRGPRTGAPRAGHPAAVETVVEKWGDGDAESVAKWLMALAEACDAQSRIAVAQRLGYSPGVISQLLNNTYNGDLGRAEEVVEGVYLSKTVDCPMAGEIGRNRCLDIQRDYARPQASPWRQKMFRDFCLRPCVNRRAGSAAPTRGTK